MWIAGPAGASPWTVDSTGWGFSRWALAKIMRPAEVWRMELTVAFTF